MALSPAGFVTRNGARFWCGERPFYFHGVEIFGLVINPGAFDSEASLDTELDWCAENNIRVVRAHGFYDGPAFGGNLFQDPRGGTPAETEAFFTGFDLVVKKATDYNVRLILPLANGEPNDFGGMLQYAQWGVDEAVFAGPASSRKGEFIKHATLRTWYKTQIAKVLNRVNSLTGVAYKDDPAIMAWEIGSETKVQGQHTVAEWNAWRSELAVYVKSIDANHLVGTGCESYDDTGSGPGTPYSAAASAYSGQHWMFDGTKCMSFSAELDDPNIDFGCVHLYPAYLYSFTDAQGITLINEKTALAHSKGKPIIFEEYGTDAASRATAVYRPWLAAMNALGANSCIWDVQSSDDVQGSSALTLVIGTAGDNTDVLNEVIAANAVALAKNIYEAPVLDSVNPTTVVEGSADTPVNFVGTKFVSVSVPKLNGVALATYTVVSPTLITGTLPASALLTHGEPQLTVFTPTPGGGTSAARTFTITATPPPPPPPAPPEEEAPPGGAVVETLTGRFEVTFIIPKTLSAELDRIARRLHDA